MRKRGAEGLVEAGCAGAGHRGLRRLESWGPVLVAVILVHIPLWLLRPYSALPQPVFELDLLLALAVFALNRQLGTACTVLAWTLSVVRGVAVDYHFHNLAEFIDSARFVDLLSTSTVVTYIGVLSVAALFAIAVTIRLLSLLHWRAQPVLAVATLLFLLDVANGSASMLGLARDRMLVPFNTLGSPSYNLLRAEMEFQGQSGKPLVPIKPLPHSYEVLREHAASGGHGSALLVLVESMGWPRESAIRDWLFAQFDAPGLRDHWTVEMLAEPFHGGTIAAEVRALCGSSGHYSRLTPLTARDCLPRLFSAQGFHTTGLHGFSPRMFDRGQWWPAIGFQQTVFEDYLFSRGAKLQNGAFNAVSDHDLLSAALTVAHKPDQFVYALTIGTHLPVPAAPLGAAMQSLCVAHHFDDMACQQIEMGGALLKDIASQLSVASEPALIVIVGDHSPPFIRPTSRQEFSQDRVPLIVLRRR